MSFFTKVFPNPLNFTALVNGLTWLGLGIYLAVRIYPSETRFCAKAAYTMPVAAFIGALFWIVYFLITCFRTSNSKTPTHHDSVDGVWRRPIGFSICAALAGIGPLIMLCLVNIDDNCGPNSDLRFVGLFMILIIVFHFVSSCLFFTTRPKATCIPMTPIRYICGIYFFAPFTIFVWFLMCCTPFRHRHQSDCKECAHHHHHHAQQQLTPVQSPPNQSQQQQEWQSQDLYEYEQRQLSGQNYISSDYVDQTRSPIYNNADNVQYGGYSTSNLWANRVVLTP